MTTENIGDFWNYQWTFWAFNQQQKSDDWWRKLMREKLRYEITALAALTSLKQVIERRSSHNATCCLSSKNIAADNATWFTGNRKSGLSHREEENYITLCYFVLRSWPWWNREKRLVNQQRTLTADCRIIFCFDSLFSQVMWKQKYREEKYSKWIKRT